MKQAQEPEILTIDEWVKKNADGLAKDIAFHILNLGGLTTSREEADLLRTIMTSIRQWHAQMAEGRDGKV